MAAIAQYALIDAGPLSLAGLERLVDRLPAETRARLKWSPVEVRSALKTFLDSPKDDASLKQLVVVITAQFRAISPAIAALAEQPELLRSELEEAWRADAAVLDKSVDAAAADAAAWVMQTWKAFMDWSLSMMHSMRADLPKLLDEAGADPNFEGAMSQAGAPFRAQGLMMAAIESARLALPSDVTSELVFRAFDEGVLMLQDFQRIGVRLDPFRGETLAERGERLRRYAEHLRGSMTDADTADLETSRLRSLR